MLAGGFGSLGSPIGACYVYDIVHDVYEELPQLRTPRAGAALLLSGSDVYVVGGLLSSRISLGKGDGESMSFAQDAEVLEDGASEWRRLKLSFRNLRLPNVPLRVF